MKKRVYIVDSHHHVLREWFRYRGSGVQVLSFDYHTDFHKAFTHASYQQSEDHSGNYYESYICKHKYIPCDDEDGVGKAVNNLINDEHIDFAIRSGMIEKAFVFSHDDYPDGRRVLTVPVVEASTGLVEFMPLIQKSGIAPTVIRDLVPINVGTSQDEKSNCHGGAVIVSYPEFRCPLATPRPYDDSTEEKMATIVTADDVLEDVLKTFKEHGFNQDNFILDFDCDFIRDRDAMTHGKFEKLKNLIKTSKAITIAREPYYVDECSGHALSCDEVERWLIGLIKSCIDNVEIFEESV